MLRGGGADGTRSLPGLVLAGAAVLLVAAVLQVRPTTAAHAGGWAAGAPPSRAAAAQPADRPGARAVAAEAVPVLHREGTAGIRLEDDVEGLLGRGWSAEGTAGCLELVGPSPEGVRVRGWARHGRVVAVRVEAPATPGLLLPTAVRTGWPVEAVAGGADGVLVATTTDGPHGEPVTLLSGTLPLDVWPPAGRPEPPGTGRPVVAPDPPPPSVELVLADAGTGRVVSAEVRVPAGAGCPAQPGPG